MRTDIQKVWQGWNTAVVNEMLSEGWVLVNVTTVMENDENGSSAGPATTYVLGLPR